MLCSWVMADAAWSVTAVFEGTGVGGTGEFLIVVSAELQVFPGSCWRGSVGCNWTHVSKMIRDSTA